MSSAIFDTMAPGLSRPLFDHERRSAVDLPAIAAFCDEATSVLSAHIFTAVDALADWLEERDPSFVGLLDTGGLWASSALMDAIVRPLVDTAWWLLDGCAAEGWASAVAELGGDDRLVDAEAAGSVLDAQTGSLTHLCAWRAATGPLAAAVGIAATAQLGGFDGVAAIRAATLKRTLVEYAQLPVVMAHRAGRVSAMRYGLGELSVHMAERRDRGAEIYASELLDSGTCRTCRRIDGTRYSSMADALEDYPKGIYVSCEAGPRCRGTLVIVSPDEVRPEKPGLISKLRQFVKQRFAAVSVRRASDVPPGVEAPGSDQAWRTEGEWAYLRKRPTIRVRRIDQRRFELQQQRNGTWFTVVLDIWARVAEYQGMGRFLPPTYNWMFADRMDPYDMRTLYFGVVVSDNEKGNPYHDDGGEGGGEFTAKDGAFGDPKSHEVSSIEAFDAKALAKMEKDLMERTGLTMEELNAQVQANIDALMKEGVLEHASWYKDATKMNSDLAKRHGISPEQMAGIIAVTSALTEYGLNVRIADKICEVYNKTASVEVTADQLKSYNEWASKSKFAEPHPDLKPGTYGRDELPADFLGSEHGLKLPDGFNPMTTDNTIKSIRILRGEPLPEVVKGPKQRNFTVAHLDPTSPYYVTVDTWHWRALMGDIPVEFKGRKLSLAEHGAKGADGKKGANAQKILQSKSYVSKTPVGAYAWAKQQTQIAAKRYGMDPNGLQAVIWNAQRARAGYKPTTLDNIMKGVNL